jgi:Bardet-Biedl syndrome 5 protein
VLVAETAPQPQKFLLGFQVKPEVRLDGAVARAAALVALAAAKPEFGLRATEFVDPQHLSESTQALFDDAECAPFYLVCVVSGSGSPLRARAAAESTAFLEGLVPFAIC